MKLLGFTFILVILFILGYSLQSSITPLLVETQAAVTDTSRQVNVDGVKLEVDLVDVDKDEAPDSVVLKKQFKLESDDGTMTRKMHVGDNVDLREFDETGMLTVGDPEDADFTGRITASETDIFEQLGRQKLAALRKKPASQDSDKGKQGEVADKDTKKTSAPEPDKATETADAGADSYASNGTEDGFSEPNNDPVAETGMGDDDDSTTEPFSKPDSDDGAIADNGADDDGGKTAGMGEDDGSEETPEKNGGQSAAPKDVVGLMKESIKSGAVKEFTFDQVDKWTAGEEENVDGVTYRTGVAQYKAETIFGLKPVQAKALIKDDKVQKWVYSKTGMEIR